MAFIVVGIDGSNAARNAFHTAVEEARWRDADIVALHVVIVPPVAKQTLNPSDLERLERYGHTVVRRELDSISAAYDDGIPVEVEQRVIVGHPGTEIIRSAVDERGNRAELVVLGSRGLGGFKGLLLGSITTYATNHLPGRLMIVPAPIYS